MVTARFMFNPLIALDLFVESFGAAERKPRQCLVVNVLLVADSELEVGVCSRKRALKGGLSGECREREGGGIAQLLYPALQINQGG